MTILDPKNPDLEISRGNVNGISNVHKFGYNGAVGTGWSPICSSGVYQTPSAAVSLAAKSSSANDTAAGSGAQQVTIEYIKFSDFTLQTHTFTMAGVSETASVSDVGRLLRAYVGDSGAYGTASAGSHAGTITILVAGGGATWGTIDILNSFPLGQSLIGAYTVPAGKTAYIRSILYSIASTKVVNLAFFKRENADDVTTPYSPIRVQNLYVGLESIGEFVHETNESYSEKTDIGFMGYVASGTAEVSIEFELNLIDN